MTTATSTFDFIICGGGTAGCALACRLKQGDPELSILVLERGKDEQRDPSVLSPLGVASLPGLGLVSSQFSTPQKALDGKRVELRAGNMLSGSSGVNAGLWMRGHSKDYDLWAQIVGDDRWSYKGLLPYFKRTETHHDVNASKNLHGFDGPIHTSTGPGYPLKEAAHQCLAELGLKDNQDGNDGDPFGISAYTENWRPSRQPAGIAYGLVGVDVITDAKVARVVLDSSSNHGVRRAVGLELVDGRYFDARREIVLCCGSYRTPQILMLSGIGPTAQLTNVGIEVAVESPDVGSNLFDHLGCYTCWRLTPGAAAEGLAMGSAKFNSKNEYMEGLPCDWMAIDSLSEAELKTALIADGWTAVDDHPLVSRATHWYTIMYMPIALGEGYNIGIDGAHISIGVLNLQPTSRGSVTLSSKDPLDDPVLDPQYISTKTDQYILRTALRRALRLAEFQPMKEHLDGEVVPQGFAALDSRSSDADIDARIRKYCTTIHHPAGTAAMGTVVDSELRVKGVNSLRICDASIFPAPLSATTQATVYAVAERLADMMLGRSTA